MSPFPLRALARFAARELKVKQVVVLADGRDTVGSAVAAAFVKAWPREENYRAALWPFESDAPLADLAGRLAKARPEAVLFAGPARDPGTLSGLLPSDGPRPPFLYAGEADDLAEFETVSGAYALTTFVIDDGTPRAGEFAKRYRERFGEEPDGHAAAAYEGAALLFEAMRRAGSSRPEHVREKLAGLTGFEGLSGPMTVDAESRHARRPTFVVRREAGQTKLVKRFDADLSADGK